MGAVAAKRGELLLAEKWMDGVTEEQAHERPTHRVAQEVLDAKRMARFAAKYASQLKKIGVDVALPGAAQVLAARLQNAELEWQQDRLSLIGKPREKLRTELVTLRLRALKTLVFAWRHDPEKRATLASITEGDGSLADLTQDAEALAKALRATPEALKLDPKLKNAAQRLTELSEKLSDTAHGDTDLMISRNCVAHALDGVLTELEAGLDFLFRDEPEKRRQYAPIKRIHSKKQIAPTPQ